MKPLIDTNPYLKDKKAYEKALAANVLSSTAIELGTIPPALERELKKPEPQK